jgi:predicted RNase H-like HicB family nuclease
MQKLPIDIVAEWDPEASVWVATSEDIHGLAIEAATLERLVERLPGVIEDLVEGNHPELAALADIPFEVHASVMGRVLRSA